MTEDKKHSTASTSNDVKNEAQNDGQKEEEDRHRDRKKLKKHRKEKMRRLTSEDGPGSEYIKKKKKKHKCCEEHGKHRRHHKKHHRKHKKRHHSICKEHSSSSGDDHRQKSSSDYMDSNKSNEDSLDSNDRLSTLIAVEKSPEENMKTVIKKAVLSKKSLVKNAVLDFSNLNKITLKKEDAKDNLKDSGIGLEEPLPETAAASTSTDTSKKVINPTRGKVLCMAYINDVCVSRRRRSARCPLHPRTAAAVSARWRPSSRGERCGGGTGPPTGGPPGLGTGNYSTRPYNAGRKYYMWVDN